MNPVRNRSTEGSPTSANGRTASNGIKIVIDARFLRTSTGRYIDRLLEHLQQIDKENQYIVLLMRKDFNSWEPSSPNFSKKATNATQYTWREQLILPWTLYRLRANLVHFTMPNYPMLYFKRFVVTIHDLSLIDFRDSTKGALVYKIKHLMFRKVMWFAVHFSRVIITPTDYVKNQVALRYKVKNDKIVRTYEAVDRLGSDSSTAHHNHSQQQRYIMYVGNSYPRKNLKFLADAFAEVKTHFSDLELIYVGKMDTFYEDLRDYVQKMGIGGIQFTGFVSDDSLDYLYRHATAYVFPSLSEGFGLPGLEALSYDVPLLAADASCLPEVYADAAVYFDPHDTHDLARKLSEVISNDELRAELITRGRARLNDFSWEGMAEETLGVYTYANLRKKDSKQT